MTRNTHDSRGHAPENPNAQNTSIPLAVIGHWFVNGNHVLALKKHVQKQLLKMLAALNIPDVQIEQRALLGRNGALTLDELTKSPELLNTRTVTRVLAATRKSVIDLFIAEFADEARFKAATDDVIRGLQTHMRSVGGDLTSVAEAFTSRNLAEQQADVAVCMLRAIDEDNQRLGDRSGPRHSKLPAQPYGK